MNARLITLLLAISFLLVACTPGLPSRWSKNSGRQDVTGRVPVPRDIPKPPWQVWSEDSFGVAEFKSADDLLAEGKLQDAIQAYRVVELGASDPAIREEAFLRRVGTELKIGRSRLVLEEISAFLSKRSLGSGETPAALAIIVAYGYVHQRDIDQTLAWLGVSHRGSAGQGIIASRALEEARRAVRRIPVPRFDSMAARWANDPFAGPLFSEERARRAQGGRAEFDMSTPWFTAKTYGLSYEEGTATDTDVSADEVAGSSDNELVIGVLLPLSGRFSLHADRIRQGIELAADDFGKGRSLRIVFADTGGDEAIARQEYEQLVIREGVDVVLGPLLVKTAEAVAMSSESLGVPFITFTKREGIPRLGNTVFRLGATTEDQVAELVAFAMDTVGLKTFSILSPQSSGGEEFSQVFQREVQARNGTILESATYRLGDEETMRRAVSRVSRLWPEALFIPDSLENAVPLLEEIHGSDLKRSVLMGPAYWHDPVALRGFGRLLDGAVYVTPFYSLSAQPNIVSFIQRYRRRFHSEPELLSAQAYDATGLIIENVPDSVSDARAVVQALQKVPMFGGVTGRLQIAQDGEITRRMSVLHLRGGEIVEVMNAGTTIGYVDVKKEREEIPGEAGGAEAEQG